MMDISLHRFYIYIGHIGDILTDILKKNINRPKIDKKILKI